MMLDIKEKALEMLKKMWVSDELCSKVEQELETKKDPATVEVKAVKVETKPTNEEDIEKMSEMEVREMLKKMLLNKMEDKEDKNPLQKLMEKKFY